MSGNNTSNAGSTQAPASGMSSIDRYLAEARKDGPWTGISSSPANAGSSVALDGSKNKSGPTSGSNGPTSGGTGPGYASSMAASHGSAHGNK